MVMVRSELLSRSSQFDMRIMAPLNCLVHRIMFNLGDSVVRRCLTVPNFGNFRATLADDAADELVRHRHLLGLLRSRRWHAGPRSQMTAGQSG